MAREKRQAVRFLFLRLDPTWRRISPEKQAAHKEEFAVKVKGFHAKLLLRTYSLVGTRGDTDMLLWQAAEDLETLQQFETAILSTKLGSYLETAYSYIGLTKRSEYEFPDDPEHEVRDIVRPQDSRYLFVYPFVKRRDWYQMPQEQRQDMMTEHVRIGRGYPDIRINTTYSFGLDDQEFVVAFEGDDPGEFLDLVMELRSSDASGYTEQDTPIFTCVQMSIWDVLDSLGGTPLADEIEISQENETGMARVAQTQEIPPGSSKRVYLGSDAIAVFNVEGRFYAVSDRCTHGRASLSEGTVDTDACILTCPWHGGKFELETGKPAGGPTRVPVRTYRVEIDGEKVLVGPDQSTASLQAVGDSS